MSAPQPLDTAPMHSAVREVLAWYAEQAAGCRKLGSLGDPARQALDSDGGKRARAALALPTPGAGGWSQAVADVLAERHRQVSVEGWTPEHDDGHARGELARATAAYALTAYDATHQEGAGILSSYARHAVWPWEVDSFKPCSARRDLVKAVALGLAEIERLDRQAAAPDATP